MPPRSPLSLLRLSTRPLLRPLSTRPHPSPLTPSAASKRPFLTYATLLTAGLSTGLLLSLYLPRPQLLQLLYPLPTAAPHAADSPEARKAAEQLEREVQSLPLVVKLRSEMVPAHDIAEGATSPAGSSLEQAATGKTELIPRYTEHRPYAATPPGPHSLTGYSLKGPNRFAISPLVFATRDKKEQIFFMHLGPGLCGHEGVVHGGLLGTVLDESLGRTVGFYLSPLFPPSPARSALTSTRLGANPSLLLLPYPLLSRRA